MMRDEKARFIETLCDSVRDIALAHLDVMPEEWDGLELREYIADKFAVERYMAYDKKRYRKRLSDYRNERIVRNL